MILYKQRIAFFIFAFLLLLSGCSTDTQPSEAVSSATDGATQNASAVLKPSTSRTDEPVPTTAADSTVSPAKTPSEKASSEPSAHQTLQNAPYQSGDNGDDVKTIQNMLISLGFDPGDADGNYGAQLVKAIKNFQLYIGLDSDGIAGQKTVNALVDCYDEAKAVSSQSDKPLKGYIIGIDPGHQRSGNSGVEPVKPGSEDMKKMVSSGTSGRYTGVPEYVINLQVSLKLKAALEALGAKVVMTREKHGVNITNAERAKKMNKAKVDCWLRIHANGSDNPETKGMFILVPAKGSMATQDDSVREKSVKLAKALLNATVKTTGAKNLGVIERSDQTGFGWSKVPVCNIEMGHMTNKTEDYELVSESYQKKIVKGLVNGFISYFR